MPLWNLSIRRPCIAVSLVNLGTPDEPTAPAVRRYLKQFLSDPRAIEIPQFLWAIILNLFAAPSCPKRVAKAYARYLGRRFAHLQNIKQPSWAALVRA